MPNKQDKKWKNQPYTSGNKEFLSGAFALVRRVVIDPPASLLVRTLVLAVLLFGVPAAFAIEYRAKTSGLWNSAKTWQPRGVPGAGDSVVSVGAHTVTLAAAQPVSIGAGRVSPALVIEGAGGLVLADGATLEVRGHLRITGEGARLRIGKASRLLFAPVKEQALQLQLFGGRQRVQFAGAAGERGEIALAPGASGSWFIASEGHRDSLLAGRYGRICDALDVATGKAWSMYLANDPAHSRLVARNIEFVNSGQVGVFGLDAGEHTTVDMRGWSFKRSHPAAAGSPALWFDGYGDVPVMAPVTRAPKRIRDLVSDKEVYLRYVQDYQFENWVLGANGKAGSVRTTNNGGNARVQRRLFQVVRDSGGVGLLADLTDSVYMYSEADNPHGFATSQLRGDATLRNFWFESHFPKQSDTGDAILSNGPQVWVMEHGGKPVTLTVEHSGSIGDTSNAPSHPVFLTVNEGTGVHFRLRQNFMRQPVNFNSIALDENGITPSGTGLEFTRNIVYSPTPVQGFAIGSAAARRVVNADAFSGIDHNLYFNLRPRTGFGQGVHAMQTTVASDANSTTGNPQLRDSGRSLASWDELLGGPGTAGHAIAQMQKLNDDKGFDPRYRVTALIAYIASGYAPTDPQLLDGDSLPIVGPALGLDRRKP